jgi:hypothetical protein
MLPGAPAPSRQGLGPAPPPTTSIPSPGPGYSRDTRASAAPPPNNPSSPDTGGMNPSGNLCDTGIGVLVSPSCPTPAPVPGSCASGYFGSPPACTPTCGSSCNGHGFCSGDGTSIPVCSCFQGFTGQLCEQPVCAGTPYCSGSLHGTCISSQGSASCRCIGSWTGGACEIRTWPSTSACDVSDLSLAICLTLLPQRFARRNAGYPWSALPKAAPVATGPSPMLSRALERCLQ